MTQNLKTQIQHKQLVHLLTCYQKELCSSVTLSFIFPVYKQVVNLFPRNFVTRKNFVPLLLCLLFPLSTSNSITRSLCHFKNCSRGVSRIVITRASFTLRRSSSEARRSLSASYSAFAFSGPSINLMAKNRFISCALSLSFS